MLTLGWMLLVAELGASLFFALVFWHFWSHSAMPRSAALRATIIYAAGCFGCLLLTFFLPL